MQKMTNPPRSFILLTITFVRLCPQPIIHHHHNSCEDKQTSADVSNVNSFQLPDPAGRAGGALTSALLHITYADHHDTGKDLTFKETLMSVRTKLQGKGFEQIPQLSSSRPTNLDEKFTLIQDDFSGKRRAVMIGINYIGDDPGELRGCHYDVHNMKNYIMACHGFEEDDIVLLLDDGENIEPTAANIMSAFKKLAADAEPGDALFVHYSGHGCSIRDDDGDEDDGQDEALCPRDYATAGVLRDDDVLAMLIAPLPEGCRLTCIMDCCHSGTIVRFDSWLIVTTMMTTRTWWLLPYQYFVPNLLTLMFPTPVFPVGPAVHFLGRWSA